MDIIFKGRHTDVLERFRRHATAKLSKIERLDGNAIRVDVEVSTERNPRQSGRRERVELTIASKGPAIRAEAEAAGATVYFADEAGVRSDYHAGTTWSPVGQTPVVKNTGSRFSVNMISAVSAKGALRFAVYEGNTTAATFIDFCKRLLHDAAGPVYLIVDGHPAHRATATKEFAASTEGRLRLIYLPGYSPELNPDEWVWKNVKHDRIGKTGVTSKQDLKSKAIGALRRLQKRPGLVRAFFSDPHLRYITA